MTRMSLFVLVLLLLLLRTNAQTDNIDFYAQLEEETMQDAINAAAAKVEAETECKPGFRVEKDSMGVVHVPEDRLYGAQTARSLHNFRISTEHMPYEFIRALALVKKAVARANLRLQLLKQDKADAIVKAADEVLSANNTFLDAEFPLSIWQTGSGTQTNMNMNEVLANRASELLGGERGMRRKIHPNDDVNMCTSSNDAIPTAMNVGAVMELERKLLTSLDILRSTLEAKSKENMDIVKIGRTHLQDATPLTLGQEISGWVAQLDMSKRAIQFALEGLRELALGGSAVGTGLNTHEKFAETFAEEISALAGTKFVSAPNKFAALAGHDAIVLAHGALKTLATALFKIANDVRWMASGPRAGLGEISIPENEPGSSIMPGKVNPTQAEAMTMACAQVMGNDVAITFGGASGNFELNVYKPLILHNFFKSTRLLSDAMAGFNEHCAVGIVPNLERIQELVGKSLMLVTALSPFIGYDKAAEIAKLAHKKGITLKEAALELKYVSSQDFDGWVNPKDMCYPNL